mmetsp:Transcript_6855/g.10400  ORF Transcript_6855/g.10400 Transcript_6855/m.10400 type:complete len:88 (+) Transcript_6855:624-887(+)
MVSVSLVLKMHAMLGDSEGCSLGTEEGNNDSIGDGNLQSNFCKEISTGLIVIFLSWLQYVCAVWTLCSMDKKSVIISCRKTSLLYSS